jgi:signal transduction histidine kinase
MKTEAATPAAPAHVREYRYAIASGAILGAMLLVVAILTAQSWRTARTHERAVNAALRGYAGFAATLYREQVEALVTVALAPMRMLAASRTYKSAAELAPPQALYDSLSAAVACHCRTVLPADYVFRTDLKTGAFESVGDVVTPTLRRWIVDSLPVGLDAYRRGQTYASITGHVEGKMRVVYFSVRRDAQGTPVAAYGLEPKAGALDSVIFASALREATLQNVFVADSTPNDSLISVVARHASGDVAYRTPRAFASPHSARESVSGQAGGFVLDVVLSPAAVSKLVVGGAPTSQLPLLIGLLALTAGLVAAAGMLTWRSWNLARLRADFTTSVSHELRTPITQILLFAETIALGRVRTVAECRREARVITEEGRRLLDLVENVLHFARSERYELPINRKLTNLTSLVRETVAGFEPIATSAGVRLRTTLEDDVGARIDGPAVQRSLRNVLDNAVKYAAAGGEAHVGVVLMGARASIWVDDHGPGVPAADRARIWQAFVRLERDMNQATGGSGIGLAVVRDIVVRHGGVVRVEDAPGGGARFVLEFPGACRLGPRAVQSTRDISPRAAEL